ncbi:NUDIX hydrolase [Brachybacterium sillae]|uniref:NUDIX hydrolase n=1 Tax=Brachybacterium sillae TaxID=2810536 RepID=UPI00217D7E06|nr:NUDIX hydrolase [Brachybacterium sillae]
MPDANPSTTPTVSGPGAPARCEIQVSVDVAILSIRDGALRVLLVQRTQEPYAGHWALPGGLMEVEETPEDAARRQLTAKTGLDASEQRFHLEQLATYATPGRDPRARVVSIAHLAFVPNVDDGMGDARWWSVDELLEDPEAPQLAFDHREIVTDARERVRAKIEYTTLAAQFVDEPFTIAELRAVYGAVWGICPTAPNSPAPCCRPRTSSNRNRAAPPGHPVRRSTAAAPPR